MVLLTALGIGGATIIGAAIGFCVKNVSHKLNDMILSFAAGIMLAAAVLGLIIPAMESGEGAGNLLVVIAGILVAEIYLLDSHVSYRRGRGFLVGYGHPIHTYGYQNPRYIRAYNRAHTHTSSGRSSGGFRGGGCACACACACAGGGRAGCSQKDTYTNIERIKKD